MFVVHAAMWTGAVPDVLLTKRRLGDLDAQVGLAYDDEPPLLPVLRRRRQTARFDDLVELGRVDRPTVEAQTIAPFRYLREQRHIAAP